MNILDLFNRKRKFIHPYIIAEAGVNHEGDLNIAKRLINEAKEGGADAIKFQTYKARNLAARNSPYYWDIKKETTKNQYDLFKKYDKFWKNEFEELKDYCDKVEIEFISTPFDKGSASMLNNLMEVFKISSSDITNKPFVDFICKFGKPIILSTGASYYGEIEEAVRWVASHGNHLSLMHCVLNYPTDYKNANLSVISKLREKYPELIIGYSDHTLPGSMDVLLTSFLLGAQIIEKHFTYDKSLPGNDHYHAMDKEDLKIFHKKLHSVIQTLGDPDKGDLSLEEPARKNARRSLVASRSIDEDQVITEDDITWKRPGFGISPKYLDEVIGKKASRKIYSDEIIYWDFIK